MQHKEQKMSLNNKVQQLIEAECEYTFINRSIIEWNDTWLATCLVPNPSLLLLLLSPLQLLQIVNCNLGNKLKEPYK